MFVIKEEVSFELTINKSRFICFLIPIDSEEEANNYLNQIRKIHHKATHHCYGYIIKPNIQRSNDDGEPAGTAGVPILEVLLKQKLINLIAIVVRYYGGIPLGAKGLVRAYSKSVSETLKIAEIVEIIDTNIYQVTFGYHQIDLINNYLNEASILEKSFQEKVTYHFATNDNSIIKGIINLTAGTVQPRFLETKALPYIKKETI